MPEAEGLKIPRAESGTGKVMASARRIAEQMTAALFGQQRWKYWWDAPKATSQASTIVSASRHGDRTAQQNCGRKEKIEVPLQHTGDEKIQ